MSPPPGPASTEEVFTPPGLAHDSLGLRPSLASSMQSTQQRRPSFPQEIHDQHYPAELAVITEVSCVPAVIGQPAAVCGYGALKVRVRATEKLNFNFIDF